MIVAIPVYKSGDTYRVSSHFGQAPLFTIAEVTEGGYRIAEIVENPGTSRVHGRGYVIAGFLAKKEVSAVATLGIGRGALDRLREHGLKVYYLVNLRAGATLDEALLAIAQGKLEEALEPREL